MDAEKTKNERETAPRSENQKKRKNKQMAEIVTILRSVLDSIIVIGIATCSAVVAWAVLERKVIVPFSVRARRIVRIAAAATMGLCVTMHGLVVVEIAGGPLGRESRQVAWKGVLYSLEVLLVVVFPWTHISWIVGATLGRAAGIGRRAVRTVTAAAVVVHLVVFWKITGDPFGGRGIGEGGGGITDVGAGIGRLAAIGVPLLGALSGYGAVAIPAEMVLIALRPVADGTMKRLERQLRENERFIEEKHDKLRKLPTAAAAAAATAAAAASTGGNGGGGIVWRIAGLIGRGKGMEGEAEETLHDIEALETFGRELRSEIATMKRDREREERSKTVIGRVRSGVGIVFGVYCAYRIAAAALNLALAAATTTPSSPGTGRGIGVDPVTRVMGIAVMVLSFGGRGIDSEFWSQQLSLVFAGLMIVTSMRGFLVNAGKILGRGNGGNDGDVGRGRGGLLEGEEAPLVAGGSMRRGRGRGNRLGLLPATLGREELQEHLVIAIAEIAGIYFVTSILLMRKSLPWEFSQIITESIGEVRFEWFHRWFDAVFIVSSVCTAFSFVVSELSRAPSQFSDF